ncbi:MAG: SDR family NAD(P)-dependent oxidoreductase, partial [Oligoflexia bacterium]|nr:SDR family NAD(P)-dependent oxidoreductase [Oligoflexia bacterium]
ELATEGFPAQRVPFVEHQVVALTGGTRGITAQVALAIARRGDCALALLARTAPGEHPLNEKAAKAAIRAELKAADQRATPARIEASLAPLRRAEEARQNVEAMRALGAEVAFFSVDLSNTADVAVALSAARQALGPLTGCVHGAGVEESRPLATKDEAAFRRVHDAKALGGLALAQVLEPEAWFVSMGSVAGRFGNIGQVDYAAANQAMAQVCRARPRSLHVCWTAWADVGMAVRGGMERLLTDRGIELLPAQAGAELLVDMVASNFTGELVVAGHLGDLSLPPTHALLDSLELDGDAVTARRHLSVDRDAWIVDHSINGTPVLPGVIGVELMAAAAAATRPGSRYVGAVDVLFDKPVKLHRGQPIDVVIRAEPIDPDHVRCTLSTERTLRTGRRQTADAFQATILLEQAPETAPLPPVFLAEERINRGAIYKRFFHGEAFQVLRDAGAVASASLLADAMVEHAFIAGGLLSMPLVLESAFQAAGLHRMAVHGLQALPASVEQLTLVRSIGDGEPLHVMVRERGDVYDIDIDGGEGAVLRVRGFRMVDTGSLPDGDRFPVPKNGWPRTVTARATGNIVRTLTASERASITSRGTPRRQLDRLAGREAAKLAVARLTGWDVDRFEIHSLDSGQPVVVPLLLQGAVPVLTLSHCQGLAVAAAGFDGPLGIDREIVRDRGAAFGSTWLTVGERALVAGDPRRETAVWTCKEAVLKALGVGMALDPRLVEVVAIHPRSARAHLHGQAAQIFSGLGGRLCLTLAHEPNAVVACALIHGGRTAEMTHLADRLASA